MPERTLEDLEGYRGSRPVRVGNAAAAQAQLDLYGHVLDAAWLCQDRLAGIAPGLGRVLASMADLAARRWREADHGMREVRTAPRPFVSSKLMCWVALDRGAIRLARRSRLGGDVEARRREREAVARAILEEGYDKEAGTFVQAFGRPDLDASVLLVALVGFLPAGDPRVASTVGAVRRRLAPDGLVRRYLGDEGEPGGEGTFTLCSFWMVETLALLGRLEEATALFDRIAGHASDLGLLSEQIDTATGALLGNYPQGFTHLALIQAGLRLARAEDGRAGRGDPPEQA